MSPGFDPDQGGAFPHGSRLRRLDIVEDLTESRIGHGKRWRAMQRARSAGEAIVLSDAAADGARAMSIYRLCVTDTSGYVVDVYEPECACDEEAFHKAASLVGHASIDIWQGDRWIAWVDGCDPHRIELAHHVSSIVGSGAALRGA